MVESVSRARGLAGALPSDVYSILRKVFVRDDFDWARRTARSLTIEDLSKRWRRYKRLVQSVNGKLRTVGLR